MQNRGVTFLRATHAQGEKQGREIPQTLYKLSIDIIDMASI